MGLIRNGVMPRRKRTSASVIGRMSKRTVDEMKFVTTSLRPCAPTMIGLSV